MVIHDILQQNLDDLDLRIKKCQNEIENCPSGTIIVENYKSKDAKTNSKGSRDRCYLVQFTKIDGKRKRIRLHNAPDLLKGLIRKKLLLEECETLIKNRKAIAMALNKCEDFDLSRAVVKIKDRFPQVSDAIIRDALNADSVEGWANEPYEMSTKWPEQKRHITSRGLRVRSKSEALIAEMLYSHNIQFRYEQVLHIENADYAPDFTIMREDGKIFYWEHEGLTNDRRYLVNNYAKLQVYSGKGIVPWDNLIVTYDNTEGMIDTRRIEAEINTRLII